MVSIPKKFYDPHNCFFGIVIFINFQFFFTKSKFHYDKSYSLNFNRSIPIGFEIILIEGDTLRTKGFLKGKLSWNKLDIEVTGGRIKDGYLIINNFSEFHGDFEVTFAVGYKKSVLMYPIKLPLNFTGIEIADFRPENGKDARNRGGRILLPLIFKNWSFDGKDGRDGGHGKNGPFLHVDIDLQKINDRQIIVAKVQNSEDNKTKTFFVDAKDGELKILADGSNGGRGGNGGPGDDPNEDEMFGANGGIGGDGGNGGNGGTIEMVYEEQVQPFLNRIIISNKGGKGGEAGLGGDRGYDFYSPVSEISRKSKSGSKGFDGQDGSEVIILQSKALE